MQEPSIGRIVHFMSRGSLDGEFPPEMRAAIITRVHGDGIIDLAVFSEVGVFFNRNVVQGENPGQWSWPARV